MTAKRFRVNELVKYNYSEIGEYIDENHTDKPLRNDEVAELLNELHEENEQLKYNLSAHMIDLNNYKGKCSALEIENEQLKQKIKELQGKASSWKITASEQIMEQSELVKENVKLKSENNMLKHTIGRNEAYIERITHKGEWSNTSDETSNGGGKL